jgi:hypothetical protein
VVSPNPFQRPRAVLSLNIGGVPSGKKFSFVSEMYFWGKSFSSSVMINIQADVLVLNRSD